MFFQPFGEGIHKPKLRTLPLSPVHQVHITPDGWIERVKKQL
jgi:hypothetical protein